jgi:serine/threonine protein kinase
MTPPRIGSKLIHGNNHYLIEKELGSGTYGTVFKAVNEANNQLVAIKYMKYQTINGITYSPAKEYRDEISSYTKFSRNPKCSQYIVCLYDAFMVNQDYFLVYEKMNGDLDHFIPKDFQTLLNIMIDTLSALQYMHSQFYAHRDIKPANILYDSNNHFKLADLGMICKSYMCTALGTPLYVDPEFIMNWDKQVSWEEAVANDIWGLGMVFFDMVIKYMLANGVDTKKYYKTKWGAYFPFDPSNNVPSYQTIKSPFKSPPIISDKWQPIINNLIDTMLNNNQKARGTASELLLYLTDVNMCRIDNKNLDRKMVLTSLKEYNKLTDRPVSYTDKEDVLSLCDKLALVMDRVPKEACPVKNKELGNKQLTSMLNLFGLSSRGTFAEKCSQLQNIFLVNNDKQRREFTYRITKMILQLAIVANKYPEDFKKTTQPKYDELIKLIYSTGNPRELLSVSILQSEVNKWIQTKSVSDQERAPAYTTAIQTAEVLINNVKKYALSSSEKMDIS